MICHQYLKSSSEMLTKLPQQHQQRSGISHNMMKAPKHCHYSATSSLTNRVNCVVSQKNKGSSNVKEVNKSVGISPIKFYIKHAEHKDKQRKRQLEYENTIVLKNVKLKRNQAKVNKMLRKKSEKMLHINLQLTL